MMLSYKGYILKAGETPVHTRKGLKNITTVVTAENYKQVITEIDGN